MNGINMGFSISFSFEVAVDHACAMYSNRTKFDRSSKPTVNLINCPQ